MGKMRNQLRPDSENFGTGSVSIIQNRMESSGAVRKHSESSGDVRNCKELPGVEIDSSRGRPESTGDRPVQSFFGQAFHLLLQLLVSLVTILRQKDPFKKYMCKAKDEKKNTKK